MRNSDGSWRYYSGGLAIVFFFDLDINEVPMRLHRIMKELHEDRRYQMIVSSIEITHVEETTKDGEIHEVPKHTLLIIASPKRLDKKTLSKIFDRMFAPPGTYSEA